MDETEFERLLKKKYAQIVLNELLDAPENSYAFTALREKVNTIVADDSVGAKELGRDEEYSPATLSLTLSQAEEAGIVTHYLNDNGEKRWRLHPTRLSQSQIDEIRSKNSSNTIHMDTPHHDGYGQRHTDSTFS
ncbi:hypothetical protein [Natronomonas gomsonensis]|uniref:hypothetical protein n=1 Tax=Natronomonas gomsonensis TaxID=1046043 RepID=UPI0015B7DEEE|nr:hypothetical protein [Natronomonas gomsonensis]